MADDDTSTTDDAPAPSDTERLAAPGGSADSIGVAIEALRAAQFRGSFRGYARADVDGFLQRLADALQGARDEADTEAREVREIADFARRALEWEIERGKGEANRVIAEAEEQRREAEAQRDIITAERNRLAEDTERARAELKAELEHAREATLAVEAARDDVVAERDRLAETRQALDNERQELAGLRDEARAAEGRTHELRRQLLAETERAISDRWTELSDHMTNVGKQQATRMLELVSDFIKQLDPALLSGFPPPAALSPESRPSRVTAMPYRETPPKSS